MNRTFRYSALSKQSLRTNLQHQFAASHALRLFRSNAIYTFIPKNACSTLRLSLALENGCIKDPADFNWIHDNNGTFQADLPALLTASYTFVILRCPFARIASVYLDKIVGHTADAWQMYDTIKRSQEISSMTFDYFVKKLADPGFRNSNIHWKPQIDFLVYDAYDDYFCVEQFSSAIDTLRQKINLSVVDARKLTGHGIDNFTIISEKKSFASMTALEIMNLKATGLCPDPKSLYTNELLSIIQKIYQKDIELYVQQFGSENLLFPTYAMSEQNIAVHQAILGKKEISTKCCNLCGKPALSSMNSQIKQNGVNSFPCSHCGALLIHRIERRIMQALPVGFLSKRRGLYVAQIHTKSGINSKALRSLTVLPASDEGFKELADLTAESYDFIVCHGLELVEKDTYAFGQLCRLLSPCGVLQLYFDVSEFRESTIDQVVYTPESTVWHAYGRDLEQRFQFAENNLTVILHKKTDAYSDQQVFVHCLFKNAEVAAQMKPWLIT